MWYKIIKKQNIVAGRCVTIMGNPIVKGRLEVAMDDSILSFPHTKTIIHSGGDFLNNGIVRINRGCRIEIGDGATLELNNCFINNNCLILCKHGIKIGSESAIGWNTQICDEDFHEIVRYECNILRGGGAIFVKK